MSFQVSLGIIATRTPQRILYRERRSRGGQHGYPEFRAFPRLSRIRDTARSGSSSSFVIPFPNLVRRAMCRLSQQAETLSIASNMGLTYIALVTARWPHKEEQ